MECYQANAHYTFWREVLYRYTPFNCIYWIPFHLIIDDIYSGWSVFIHIKLWGKLVQEIIVQTRFTVSWLSLHQSRACSWTMVRTFTQKTMTSQYIYPLTVWILNVITWSFHLVRPLICNHIYGMIFMVWYGQKCVLWGHNDLWPPNSGQFISEPKWIFVVIPSIRSWDITFT